MSIFRKIYSLLFILFIPLILSSQEKIAAYTQTIKGRIVNYQTQQPIPGVTVRLLETNFGGYSKRDGFFKIKDVPVGRYSVKFSAIGFESQQFNIIISSGKEEQLNIQLQESFVQMDEVTVVAERNSFEPINESAMISSTVFTLDDVERYAGSRMDPARMAQNYAGVIGANDIRNDIIIRGGSPSELLWRLDGLDIPNPNHFGTQGATGGPVNALNSTLLDNSDFLTGAWPAEYGDKMSGVFDLHTRKGNNEKYEFLGQFGFNGFELGAECPLPGEKNSFIANYRYSFLDLLTKMGIEFGFSGFPRYQDGTVKIDLQPADDHQISFTGLFGIAGIEISPSKEGDVFTTDMARENSTDLLSLGINWQYLFNEKSYGKLTIGTVYNGFCAQSDSVTFDNDDNIIDNTTMRLSEFTEGYHTAKYSYHYSPSNRHYITAGIEGRYRYYDLHSDAFHQKQLDVWTVNKEGTAFQTLSYINWNWRIIESLSANIGLHSQFLEISNKYTLEPRCAMSWRFHPLHSFNIGFGVHKQSLPLIIYYAGDQNDELDFMQSYHYIAGYSYTLADDAVLKIEAYYKDISNVPVERDEINSWSFLNSGANFGVIDGVGIDAISKGKGKTYGAEFTIIKNFSKSYYITATASYIRQQYTGSDEIWRFGAFDNQYVLNLLSGYEWVMHPSFTIEFSGKYTLAGGNPYTPIDIEMSQNSGRTEYIESEAFAKRKSDYSRFDLRIDFRNNFKSFSIISYVSAENVLSTKNVYGYQYNRRKNEIETIYQLGFFFVGGVRIEF